MAYKESGVAKHTAKYKIIVAHGFVGNRNDGLPASKEVIQKLGVYVVCFDKPGYGESDPNPERSVKRIAFDIEQLADQLELGPKFYIMGISIGGHSVWSCLKYIPHRWPGFPKKLSAEAYRQQARQDQWALRVLYYAPWLTYWWMTQTWFASSTTIKGDWKSFNCQDNEMRIKAATSGDFIRRVKGSVQQGVFESLHRDLMVIFGKWDFDPMDLKVDEDGNNVLSSVHIWQGEEDALVSVILQRYICKKLPWIQYHELRGAGHLYYLIPRHADCILNSFLTGSN